MLLFLINFSLPAYFFTWCDTTISIFALFKYFVNTEVNLTVYFIYVAK